MQPLQIKISILEQRLFLIGPNAVLKSWSISTAERGVGEQNGSGCTPLGLHQIAEKLGAEAPTNTVFVARQATGEIYSAALAHAYPDRDWILTRILWLKGCELGFNQGGDVDSYSRYIYIHGTPDSEPMGVPRSNGCIRMRNKDMIELFDQVEVGTEVRIEE